MDTKVGELSAQLRGYFFRLSRMPSWRMYLSLLLTFGIPYSFVAVVYSVFTEENHPRGLAANILVTLALVPIETISVTLTAWVITRLAVWLLRKQANRD